MVSLKYTPNNIKICCGCSPICVILCILALLTPIPSLSLISTGGILLATTYSIDADEYDNFFLIINIRLMLNVMIIGPNNSGIIVILQ